MQKKKRHYFIGDFALQNETVVVTDPEVLHQWNRVLRFAPGEEVMLSDGKGACAPGKIIALEKKSATVARESLVASIAPPPLVLSCAMIRKERFEWMLEKAVEVGVTAIVPLETARTVRFPWKPERFRTIMKEAAEQSEHAWLPELHEPVSFKAAVKSVPKEQEKLLCDPSGMPLTSGKRPPGGTALFIGPEGGWDEKEIEEARAVGCELVRIGDAIYRTETAALLACFLRP